MADPRADSGQPRAYEALIQQYLDGRPIAPATSRSTAAERDRAFFCHPLWEDVPRAAVEHELFAVSYARSFRQAASPTPDCSGARSTYMRNDVPRPGSTSIRPCAGRGARSRGSARR